MKHLSKVILMLLAFAISISGCAGQGDVASAKVKTLAEKTNPKPYGFEDIDTRVSVLESNPVDGLFIEGINNFSLNTASRLLVGDKGNTNYSPISLYYALGMAAAGAAGGTQAEILSLLGADDIDTLQQQCSNLYRLTYTDNEISKLKIANSLWMDNSMNLTDDYSKAATEGFYASVFGVDFSGEGTGKSISEWISINTNGTLAPDINIDKDQVMSIINTIYFYDEWLDRFDEGKTKADTFTLADGNKVECDFMNATFGSHGFSSGDGWLQSSLQLKNQNKMVFILPDEGTTTDDMLNDVEKLEQALLGNDSSYGEVVFQIPKFSFGKNYDMKEMLTGLGMEKAFDPDAEFTGIDKKDNPVLFISNVIQGTHIAIDEKGVEASAYTQIDYPGAALPEGRADMILDRPFIFAIVNNTGSLMFIGVCNDPTAQ